MLVQIIFKKLEINQYYVRLSLPNFDKSKYIGNYEKWNKAELALRKVLKQLNILYTEKKGEAAFYGPKIDFIVIDAIGRNWQLGTIQVDYNLPELFNLIYVNSKNQNSRPVIIHRAPFGSIERFCSILIEHFEGNFPVWLSCEQVRIIPLTDSIIQYCEKIFSKIKKSQIRSTIDTRQERLGAKIRKAEIAKIPYILIVGDKEKKSNSVSIRSRNNNKIQYTLPFEEFLEKLKKEIKNRVSKEN